MIREKRLVPTRVDGYLTNIFSEAEFQYNICANKINKRKTFFEKIRRFLVSAATDSENKLFKYYTEKDILTALSALVQEPTFKSALVD